MPPRKVSVNRANTDQAMHVARLASEERKATIVWSKILREFGNEASHAYRDGNTLKLAYRSLAASVNKGLQTTWASTAATFAKASYASVAQAAKSRRLMAEFKARKPSRGVILGDKAKLPTLVDEFLTQYTAQFSAEKIKSITATQKVHIQRIVDLGIEDGSSTDDIAQQIEEAYSKRGVFSDATRIARTETHAAANAGGMVGAGASGVVTGKTWNNVFDTRVRPSHGSAQGQKVKIDDLFTVEGEDLSYPGDPAGSAANVINCRCFMTYQIDG